MDGRGRRTGTLAEALEQRPRGAGSYTFRLAASRVPPVVALVLPAARSRPVEVDIPPGVTVYEFDPARGVRILRQGGPFWSVAAVPQRRWLWAFRTRRVCQDLFEALRTIEGEEVRHEWVDFNRARERHMEVGRHPLEYQRCRRFLFRLLERVVAEEVGAADGEAGRRTTVDDDDVTDSPTEVPA